MKYKMVIVMRNDLNMRKGKMIAQGAHAATMCFIQGGVDIEKKIMAWLTEGHMGKICVRVDSEEELLDILAKASAANLEVHLVTDAGFTEFGGVATRTCLAIGPELSEEIDKITGHLKLL